ncbi:peroxisomal membrane protein 11-5-like protein [Carex littledalei]|uniref:Peroxisomal membrane protein 11-5-like protein n=1 Tax=Carex littledalei TaxID=544730 RepID=A0A833QMS6_9POAL|nr:peroxisomal membrane protein 11-5-like protein [Carex littledalei]
MPNSEKSESLHHKHHNGHGHGTRSHGHHVFHLHGHGHVTRHSHSHHGHGHSHGSTHKGRLVQHTMHTLEVARFDVAVLALYFNKAEARDKFCRAIQYFCKFINNGQPGIAYDIEKSSSLARKAFRIFKFVNDLYAFLTPPPERVSLFMIILGKVKNLTQGTFLFLDQFSWAAKTGLYKDKKRAEQIGKISLYSWFVSCVANTIMEVCVFRPLCTIINCLTIRRLELAYRDKMITLIKAFMDLTVGVGLLKLKPKIITPRVTGVLGFLSSLISCYKLIPKVEEAKKKTPIYRIEAYESPQ